MRSQLTPIHLSSEDRGSSSLHDSECGTDLYSELSEQDCRGRWLYFSWHELDNVSLYFFVINDVLSRIPTKTEQLVNLMLT